MTFEVPEDGEPWQTASGYVPFIIAEARLMVVKRAIPAVAATGDKLVDDIRAEADEYLSWVRSDAEAAVYIGESEDYAADQISWVAGEQPRMFFGQLIVYLLSLLESVLVETIKNAAAIFKAPSPRAIANPKIENCLKVLDEMYEIKIEWPPEIWGELRWWRQVRNTIVHQIEMHFPLPPDSTTRSPDTDEEILSASSIFDLIDLVEAAIAAVDLAMADLPPTAG